MLNCFLANVANFIVYSARFLQVFLPEKYCFSNSLCLLSRRYPEKPTPLVPVFLHRTVKMSTSVTGIIMLFNDLAMMIDVLGIELRSDERMFIDTADLTGLCRVLQHAFSPAEIN
jgi:hypothetical protein